MRFQQYVVVNSVVMQVSTCDLCQRMNSKLTTATPELHPVPVQSPWLHLRVNFIGPISPVSSKTSLSGWKLCLCQQKSHLELLRLLLGYDGLHVYAECDGRWLYLCELNNKFII